MKHLTILLLLLLGLATSCTGNKAEKTTPDPGNGTGNGGPSEPGNTRDSVPTGPSSDLCTDSQCPGVVR